MQFNISAKRSDEVLLYFLAHKLRISGFNTTHLISWNCMRNGPYQTLVY